MAPTRANRLMKIPSRPDQTLPLSRQMTVNGRLNSSTSTIPSGVCSSVVDTLNGVRPSRPSPHTATAMNTTWTDSRPSSLQYTSSRCRTSANSSSTSAVPIPNTDAVIAAHADLGSCTASPLMPPTHMNTSPNTTWWMCVPPAATLPGHHFTCARIIRTLNLMNKNARMKKTRKQNKRSLPASTITY
jgi:hypothetical protein